MIERTGVIGGMNLPEKAEHTREIVNSNIFYALFTNLDSKT